MIGQKHNKSLPGPPYFIVPGLSSVYENSVIVSFEYYKIVLTWLIHSLPSKYFCWLFTMLNPALEYRSERWIEHDPAFPHQRQIYKHMIANVCMWQKSVDAVGTNIERDHFFLGCYDKLHRDLALGRLLKGHLVCKSIKNILVH